MQSKSAHDQPASGHPPGNPPNKLWRRPVLHHRRVVAVSMLLALALFPGLTLLETDNSPSVFFVHGSDTVARYQRFQETFPSDETVRLVVSGADLWTPRAMRWLRDAERQIVALPGVEGVSGLSSHYQRFDWPPKDLDAWRAAVAINPLDRGAGWVSSDGQTITSLVHLEALDPSATATLVEALRDVARSAPDLEAEVLGLPVLNTELDRSSKEIGRRFFPLLVLFTIVLLALAVRSFRQLLAPLLFVGLCELALMASMGYAGEKLNMVLAVLPPLIFVIALATALHVILRARYLANQTNQTNPETRLDPGSQQVPGTSWAGSQQVPGTSWADAVVRVYDEKGWSIFWTGVTTMIGFASLAISPVAPIRSLGLWAAVGLFLITVFAFTALPALAVFFGGTGRDAVFEQRVARLGSRLGSWSATHARSVLITTAVLGALAVVGVLQIRIESNALTYLDPAHPLRSGIARIEQAGIGIGALELLVALPSSDGGAPSPFVSALEVERLAELGKDLDQVDGVLGVVNAGIVLRDALRLVPSTPMNAHMRSQMALDGLSQDVQGREILDTLVSADRATARTTVFVKTGGSESIARLEQRLSQVAAERFPEGDIQVTGQYPLLLEAQRHLISTLSASLALTLIAIALVLRWLLWSSRLTLLALVPNLWPVLGGLGIMGWFGVPLDIATVMMASVVLGLAVDDTIHTLGHFRKLAPVHGAHGAVARTLYATAPAYLLTGVVLMAGFGVCALSDFAPISRFGALSAVSIGLAVLGDLILLPALLSQTPAEICTRLGRKIRQASERT